MSVAARTNDPDTSWEAAHKAAFGASKVRPVILDLIRAHGPLTYDELINKYNYHVFNNPDAPKASPSAIRSRTKDLARAGLVVQDRSGDGRSFYGNRAKRWVAVDPASFVAPTAGVDPDDNDDLSGVDAPEIVREPA